MRLIVVETPGDSSVLALTERPTPAPQRNEVRVRVHGSGLNRADLLQRRGRYPAPVGFPQDVLGLEIAGIVDAVGSDVSHLAVGDVVMGIISGGGYAEYVVMHARELMRVPKNVPPVHAAALPEAYLTAYDALFRQGELRPGETVLIHAVASGVGTAALQLALHAGANVIGTSRSSGKLERAKTLGLKDAVISEGDWPKEIARRTQGIDVVLDLVGGPMVAQSTQLLRDQGRHILVGLTAGTTSELDLGLMLKKRATLRGTVLRSRPFDEKLELTRVFERLMIPAFERGHLKPVIDTIVKPEAVASAHERLERNDSFGKIVIDWSG